MTVSLDSTGYSRTYYIKMHKHVFSSKTYSFPIMEWTKQRNEPDLLLAAAPFFGTSFKISFRIIVHIQIFSDCKLAPLNPLPINYVDRVNVSDRSWISTCCNCQGVRTQRRFCVINDVKICALSSHVWLPCLSCYDHVEHVLFLSDRILSVLVTILLSWLRTGCPGECTCMCYVTRCSMIYSDVMSTQEQNVQIVGMIRHNSLWGMYSLTSNTKLISQTDSWC